MIKRMDSGISSEIYSLNLTGNIRIVINRDYLVGMS